MFLKIPWRNILQILKKILAEIPQIRAGIPSFSDSQNDGIFLQLIF
jgi:hypothetical protein